MFQKSLFIMFVSIVFLGHIFGYIVSSDSVNAQTYGASPSYKSPAVSTSKNSDSRYLTSEKSVKENIVPNTSKGKQNFWSSFITSLQNFWNNIIANKNESSKTAQLTKIGAENSLQSRTGNNRNTGLLKVAASCGCGGGKICTGDCTNPGGTQQCSACSDPPSDDDDCPSSCTYGCTGVTGNCYWPPDADEDGDDDDDDGGGKIPAPTSVPQGKCRIQGIISKTFLDNQAVISITNEDGSAVNVTKGVYENMPDSYYFADLPAAANKNYKVSISYTTPGLRVGTTLCEDRTDCHTVSADGNYDPSFIASTPTETTGTTRLVACNPGKFQDLYFHDWLEGVVKNITDITSNAVDTNTLLGLTAVPEVAWTDAVRNRIAICAKHVNGSGLLVCWRFHLAMRGWMNNGAPMIMLDDEKFDAAWSSPISKKMAGAKGVDYSIFDMVSATWADPKTVAFSDTPFYSGNLETGYQRYQGQPFPWDDGQPGIQTAWENYEDKRIVICTGDQCRSLTQDANGTPNAENGGFNQTIFTSAYMPTSAPNALNGITLTSSGGPNVAWTDPIRKRTAVCNKGLCWVFSKNTQGQFAWENNGDPIINWSIPENLLTPTTSPNTSITPGGSVTPTGQAGTSGTPSVTPPDDDDDDDGGDGSGTPCLGTPQCSRKYKCVGADLTKNPATEGRCVLGEAWARSTSARPPCFELAVSCGNFYTCAGQQGQTWGKCLPSVCPTGSPSCANPTATKTPVPTATGTPPPSRHPQGDANADRLINIEDFEIWQMELTGYYDNDADNDGNVIDADFDSSGKVDLQDLWIYLRNEET